MDSTTRDYVVLIISGTFTMLTGGMVHPIFAPFVRMEFTAPLLIVGLAVSGYYLVRMFCEFPIGALSDRMGPRTPLIIGRVMATIGAVTCYKATEVWQLIIARALWGVGDASFYTISMAYVASLFLTERRGRALGLFIAVEMVGGFIGQATGGFIASAFGIRMSFPISAVLCAISLVAVVMLRGETQRSNRNHAKRSPMFSTQVFLMVLNRPVIVACLINFTDMAISTGVISTILPLYVTEELKIPLTEYGLVVAASTVGSVSGNFLGGLLSDKVGRKKSLAFGLVTGTVATFILPVANAFLQFIPVMFAKGFSYGITYGTTPALVADSVPDNARGMGVGAFRTFFDLGGLVGPIAISSVVEYVGRPQGYAAAFHMGSGLLFLSFLVVLQLKSVGAPAGAFHATTSKRRSERT